MVDSAGDLRANVTAPEPIGEPALDVEASLDGGDIEIGAVELKDGATDTRAKVGAGTAIVAGDNAIAVKDAVLGQADDAAVITDANGTISSKLRGLVKRWADALGAGTAAAALRTTQASDSPLVSVSGATNGAAVVTDADGTIQQYLRGLVKALVVNGFSLKPSTAGGQGSKNVTTAATPLQLAATTAIKSVIVTARIGNTKEIAVGFSNAVRATAGSEIGMCLQPGDSVTLNVNDLAAVWIDAQINGEGCSFTYVTD